MNDFSRAVRTSFLLIVLILPPGELNAQEHESTAGVGLAIGGPGRLGAEASVDLTSRARLLVQGWSGFPAGPHQAGWAGVRFRIAGDRDLHLYATPVLGVHQCYPALLGGRSSGCSDDRRWRISAAAMTGVEAALSEGGPLSFGVESGAWFVDEPGLTFSLAVVLRYRFPL